MSTAGEKAVMSRCAEAVTGPDVLFALLQSYAKTCHSTPSKPHKYRVPQHRTVPTGSLRGAFPTITTILGCDLFQTPLL